MTRVLALDQSTGRTGWTYGGSKIPLSDWKSGHFRAPRRDEEGERLIIIHDSLLSLIDEHAPDLVAYETPFDPTFDILEALKKGKQPRSNFNRRTMDLLQGVKAAVTMAAARRNLPTETYPPRSWQATLQLPKAPAFATMEPAHLIRVRQKWRKQAIFKRVRQMGGQVETEDEADSWGLAFHVLHGAPGAKRAQMSLLESL